MRNFEKPEALYLIGDKAYLHMKTTRDSERIEYAGYDKETGALLRRGEITYEELNGKPTDCLIANARVLAQEKLGLKDAWAGEVALSTLGSIKDAKKSYHKEHENDPPDRSIRFITSRYDTLFRIPDGGTVEVRFPDRVFISRCEYVDEYHVKMGHDYFHICEFAELLEKQGGTVRPEPEIDADRAAWSMGNKGYLLLRRTETGFKYAFLNQEFQETKGGYWDHPERTMIEAREHALEGESIRNRNRFAADFDEVYARMEARHKEEVWKDLKARDVNEIRCLRSEYFRSERMTEDIFSCKIAGDDITLRRETYREDDGTSFVIHSEGRDVWDAMKPEELRNLDAALSGAVQYSYWHGALEKAETPEEVETLRRDFAESVGDLMPGREVFLTQGQIYSLFAEMEEKTKALTEAAERMKDLVPALQENGLYRYYSTQRPVDIGTFPKPEGNKPVEIYNYDTDRRIPVEGASMEAWGYLEYRKPLTEKEMSDYELRPARARLRERDVFGEPEKEVRTSPDKKSVLRDLGSKKPQKRELELRYKDLQKGQAR